MIKLFYINYTVKQNRKNRKKSDTIKKLMNQFTEIMMNKMSRSPAHKMSEQNPALSPGGRNLSRTVCTYVLFDIYYLSF